METITRDVRDLPQDDRSALERVIGHVLLETERVIVTVVNLNPKSESLPTAEEEEIPQWWKVYEGLDDEEIDRLDDAIRQRANLTRDVG
jgi:hypothetical protein